MNTKALFIVLSLVSALSAFPRSAFSQELSEDVAQDAYLRLPVVDEKGDPEDYFNDCVRENSGAEGRCEAATVTFYKLDSEQGTDAGSDIE